MTDTVAKVTDADPKNQIGEAASAIEDVKGSNDFFWDSVMRYTAAGMVALTILGQAVIALVELIGGTVKCLTPNSSFNRDQSFFINEFCDRYAPLTQYLPWALILQALAILAPHFIWKSWFSGKLRFFFERAKTLDRDRDSRSGEYDLKNFKIMKALKEEFGKSARPWMFMSYVLKLFVQLFTVLLAYGLHGSVLAYHVFHPSFFCPPVPEGEVPCTKLQSNDFCNITTDDSDWPFDFNVHCVLASLITQRVVWVLNLVLLLLTAVAVCIGLVWCFLRHTQFLNWKQAALFSFESSLNAEHFVAKRLWDTLRRPTLYRISTDFKFLFMKLQRFDAGLAKVLRNVLIADIIQSKEISSQEVHKYNKDGTSGEEVKSLQKEKEIDKKLKAKEVEDPGKKYLGSTITTFIRRFMQHLRRNGSDAPIVALDVSFGSPAGYSFLLKQVASMVVAVQFDPHYLDDDKNVTVDKYGETAMYFIKTSPGIFGLPSEALTKFHGAVRDRFPNDTEQINVVVIGPLAKAERDREITLHELLKFLDTPRGRPNTDRPGTHSNTDPPGTPHSNTDPPGTLQSNTDPPGTLQSNTDPPGTPYLADDAVIIVLKPTEIEFERKTRDRFCKFTPAKSIWTGIKLHFSTQQDEQSATTVILRDPQNVPQVRQHGGADDDQSQQPSLRSRASRQPVDTEQPGAARGGVQSDETSVRPDSRARSVHSAASPSGSRGASPCSVSVETTPEEREQRTVTLQCGETVCSFEVKVYTRKENIG